MALSSDLYSGIPRLRAGRSSQIVAAAELLGQLLLQDIERKGGDGDGDDGVRYVFPRAQEQQETLLDQMQVR